MFYCFCKTTVISKTTIVKDLDELRWILQREFPMQVYPGLNVQFFIEPKFLSKLRIDIGKERIEFDVRLVIQPLRRIDKLLVWDTQALIFAPAISDSLAAYYRENGIPHGDLNGRLFFIRENEGQIVDIRAEQKKYAAVTYGRDLFSGKASRVVRAFLCKRERLFTQDELMKDTDVSRTLISQLLKQLIADGYVEQVKKGSKHASANYITADFDGLLDDWVRGDLWQKRVKIYEYSLLSNDHEKIIDDLGQAVDRENIAYTQWTAAWKRRPHTTPPIVSAYLKDISLLDSVPGRPVKSGGNLWIIFPKDEGVFQFNQNDKRKDELPLVSDIQIYLDLLQMGLHGPEQAQELREWEGFAK